MKMGRQSDIQYRELLATQEEIQGRLRMAQDTNKLRDKLLLSWNGVERELKRMDLESLHELESNMISSLQNVRKVAIKKSEQENECRVCMDQKKDTVLFPCGHSLCSKCVCRVRKCPMCRARIERSVKLR